MTLLAYEPEIYLESTVRCLKAYVEDGFLKSVVDDTQTYAGDEVYEIVMEYPSTDEILRFVPLGKTVIHFEIDDMDNRILGFGENVFNYNYDDVLQQEEPQNASEHRINFDVGIWASDRSGGITSRLRAYQVLRNLFQGGLAIEKLRAATNAGDGELDILQFESGRFLTDRINDLNVYRTINSTLVIRVFSRTPKEIIRPTIEEILQDENLSIDDQPLT